MLRNHSLSSKSYIVQIEYTYSVCFASNHIVLLIGSMNTRMNVARRHDEEFTDTGAPPHAKQVPPLEENANVDQALANPSPMTEAEMRDILARISQTMNTKYKPQRFKTNL